MAYTMELDTATLHEDGTLSAWSNEPEKAAESFCLLCSTWRVNRSNNLYFVYDDHDHKTVAVFYKIPETERKR